MRSKYLQILRYLKPYIWIALLSPLFLMIEVWMTLLIPDMMSQMINIGIKEKESVSAVLNYGGWMLLFAFLAIFFAFLSNFFSTWASCEMVNDIRITTFKKALTMSFKSLDELETGQVITRVTSDVNSLRMITKAMLRQVLRAPVMMIGAVIMAYRISPKLSIIFAIIIPIIFIANYFIVKKSYPLFQKMQGSLEDINNYTHENLANIRVVKAFNRGDYANEIFDEKIDVLKEVTIKANWITALTNPISLVVINLAITAVLYYGGLDVINMTIDMEVGNLIAFINYLTLVSGSLNMFTHILNIFPRAEASSKRILELINADLAMKDNQKVLESNFQGKIEFRNVSFSYHDGTKVLKNLSFTVHPGEKLGIIGTTGSGKSTLAYLIGRYYDATEGEIYIDDVLIQDYDLHFLRSKISMVMQKALLFSGSIGDNIRFGNTDATEEELIEVSNIADAYEFISKYPEQYNSIIGQRGINLSGGQKQRLSMARSLLTKPKILIFDDSTSAVDMTTEARILNAINSKVNDTTLIIIAQRIQSVMTCDKIIVLEQGKITGMGNHEHLLQTNTLYQEIYQAQVGGDEDESR